MKRNFVIGLAVAACALPAAASADQPSQQNQKNASKYCKALRASAGKQDFASMFGGKKNAFGKCVSRNAKKDAKQEQTAQKNAAQQCKAERDQDAAAFDQKYGTNKNKKNAYGKCVSQRSKENKQAEDQTDQNDVDAAKACRSEQSQDKDAFAQKYGTNKNKKNAFGKCVSQKSHEADQQQQEQEGGTS